jgi:hypothetical protein
VSWTRNLKGSGSRPPIEYLHPTAKLNVIKMTLSYINNYFIEDTVFNRWISSCFYATQKIITVFNFPPLIPILSLFNSVHTFIAYFPGFVLILSYYLRFDFQNCSLQWGFPARILYAILVSHMRVTLLILLNLYHLKVVRSTKFVIPYYECCFAHSPVSCPCLRISFVFITLLPVIFSLFSTLRMRDQVLRPWKTVGETLLLYSFNFYYSREQTRI